MTNVGCPGEPNVATSVLRKGRPGTQPQGGRPGGGSQTAQEAAAGTRPRGHLELRSVTPFWTADLQSRKVANLSHFKPLRLGSCTMDVCEGSGALGGGWVSGQKHQAVGREGLPVWGFVDGGP